MPETIKRQIAESKRGNKHTESTIEKIRASMTRTRHKKERMFWLKKRSDLSGFHIVEEWPWLVCYVKESSPPEIAKVIDM
jgi:hypothetical protein